MSHHRGPTLRDGLHGRSRYQVVVLYRLEELAPERTASGWSGSELRALLVDHLLARLLRRKLPAARRAKLIAVVAPAGRYDRASAATRARVRDVVLLITSMPEYQLN